LNEAAELGDPALPVELQIVEHENLLAIEHGFVITSDDQSAVKPALELHGLVDVRVIPERPGIEELEAIREGLAGLHELLNHLGTVHRCGEAHAVPMDGRRLGQPIREAHFEHVADAAFDDGSRNLTVEGPGADHGSRCDRPVGFARLELDRDDLSAGVGLGILIGLAVEVSSRRRRLVGERAVVRVNVGAVIMRHVVLG
jgi:hypothetical protein